METTQYICPRSMWGFIICKCCHTLRKLIFICGTSDSFNGKTMRTEAVDRQCTLVNSYWVSVHTEFFSNLDTNSVQRLPHQQIIIRAVYLFIVLLLWTLHTVSFHLLSSSLKQSALINCGWVQLSFEVETDSCGLFFCSIRLHVSLINEFKLLVFTAFLLMAGRNANGRQHDSGQVGRL
jgi:hypothetical protein